MIRAPLLICIVTQFLLAGSGCRSSRFNSYGTLLVGPFDGRSLGDLVKQHENEIARRCVEYTSKSKTFPEVVRYGGRPSGKWRVLQVLGKLDPVFRDERSDRSMANRGVRLNVVFVDHSSGKIVDSQVLSGYPSQAHTTVGRYISYSNSLNAQADANAARLLAHYLLRNKSNAPRDLTRQTVEAQGHHVALLVQSARGKLASGEAWKAVDDLAEAEQFIRVLGLKAVRALRRECEEAASEERPRLLFEEMSDQELESFVAEGHLAEHRKFEDVDVNRYFLARLKMAQPLAERILTARVRSRDLISEHERQLMSLVSQARQLLRGGNISDALAMLERAKQYKRAESHRAALSLLEESRIAASAGRVEDVFQNLPLKGLEIFLEDGGFPAEEFFTDPDVNESFLLRLGESRAVAERVYAERTVPRERWASVHVKSKALGTITGVAHLKRTIHVSDDRTMVLTEYEDQLKTLGSTRWSVAETLSGEPVRSHCVTDAGEMIIEYLHEVKVGKLIETFSIRNFPGANPTRSESDWDARTIGSYGLDNLLQGRGLKKGETISARVFHPGLENKPVMLRITARGKESVRVPGRRLELQRIDVRRDGSAWLQTLWFDEEFRLRKEFKQGKGYEATLVWADRADDPILREPARPQERQRSQY
ncbi:MAG: hypothetical protein O7H41_00175 [Planctomycetota bacterium]|nr:hypothetical protein [Planctomycetota bacterium]